MCTLFSAVVAADEYRGVAVPQQANRRLAVLVLTDGTVLETSLKVEGGGYSVDVPGGRQFIESSRVRFIAKDRVDAWRQLRASFQELTPDVHLQIARWCLKNELRLQAEREALDALRLDPNRQGAKRLLQQLAEDGADRFENTSLQSAVLMPPLPVAGPAAAARSLAGLRRSTTQQFVRSVQPLLSSKCATAGCHGRNSQTEFQLLAVRSGSDPRTAEQNLEAVLSQISFSEPTRSPLLKYAADSHGGQRDIPLRGRTGNLQLKTLQQWISAVAADVAPGENRESVQAVAESIQMEDTAQAEQSEHAHEQLRDMQAADREFLAEAKRSQRHDPFDPAVFNRRHHAKAQEILTEDQ